MKNKYTFCLILLFMLFSTVLVFAGEEQCIKLYGQDLLNVPVDFRNEYSLAKGMAWSDASYDQRYEFLVSKEAMIKDKKVTEKTYKERRLEAAKKARALKKEREDKEKALLKKRKERDKARIEEKKKQDEKTRKMKKDREQALKKLREAQKARHKNP
jgi:hypothetical protein